MLCTDKQMVMSKAPFLYHLPQASNSIFVFFFFCQLATICTGRVNTYQLSETDCSYVNITMWPKYHDADTINHFIEFGLQQMSQLCC